MIVKNTYDCEKITRTLNKNAINQVTQCESEAHGVESTTIVATLHTKSRAANLAGNKFLESTLFKSFKQ